MAMSFMQVHHLPQSSAL